VRLGGRARTLKVNALTTAALAVALLPALAGAGVIGLVLALMLSAGPRAVISTIAYSLASGQHSDEGRSDGVVFGILNGAWAAATVLMPLIAGAVEGAAGPDVAYVAVIVPSLAIAGCLVAGAAERVPALHLSLRGWR
jgi:MFS family permease